MRRLSWPHGGRSERAWLAGWREDHLSAISHWAVRNDTGRARHASTRIRATSRRTTRLASAASQNANSLTPFRDGVRPEDTPDVKIMLDRRPGKAIFRCTRTIWRRQCRGPPWRHMPDARSASDRRLSQARPQAGSQQSRRERRTAGLLGWTNTRTCPRSNLAHTRRLISNGERARTGRQGACSSLDRPAIPAQGEL